MTGFDGLSLKIPSVLGFFEIYEQLNFHTSFITSGPGSTQSSLCI